MAFPIVPGLTLPPAHPILVNFTAALVPVSVLCDLLGAWLRKDSLRAAAWWTLLFAAVVTPFTALAGWLWLRSMGDVEHWQMPIHQWLGTGLAVLLIPLTVWRGLTYRRGVGPGAAYLWAAALAVAAVTGQGHLGGQMSFGAAEPAAAESSPTKSQPPAATSPSSVGHHDAPGARPGGERWRAYIEVP